MGDTLLLLAPQEQRTQLERRLAAVQERQRKSQLAAKTIRSYLDSAQRIDLSELQCRIREALATTVVLACLLAVFVIS